MLFGVVTFVISQSRRIAFTGIICAFKRVCSPQSLEACLRWSRQDDLDEVAAPADSSMARDTVAVHAPCSSLVQQADWLSRASLLPRARWLVGDASQSKRSSATVVVDYEGRVDDRISPEKTRMCRRASSAPAGRWKACTHQHFSSMIRTAPTRQSSPMQHP